MGCGCGTVGHHHANHAEGLMGLLGSVRPDETRELRQYVYRDEALHAAVDTLVYLWDLQNGEIHELAMRSGDISHMTFARRELLWFRQSGPEVFFNREDIAQDVSFLSLLSSELFMEAWNDFQMLLLGVHLHYLTQVLGRIPTDRECDLWAGELRKWFRRTAVRFMPIRLKMLH